MSVVPDDVSGVVADGSTFFFFVAYGSVVPEVVPLVVSGDSVVVLSGADTVPLVSSDGISLISSVPDDVPLLIEPESVVSRLESSDVLVSESIVSELMLSCGTTELDESVEESVIEESVESIDESVVGLVVVGFTAVESSAALSFEEQDAKPTTRSAANRIFVIT